MSETSSQDFTFFVDRCLGKRLATVLKAQGLTVEIHDRHFDKNAKDTDWLPIVGQRGWVVLTKDEHIAKRSLERIAVTSARVRMFVLVSQNLSGAETAAAFTQAIAAMQQFLQEHPAPFIGKVHRDGNIVPWRTHRDLLNELNFKD
jgi:predicted nuclease of predicted toxin-antitoxin system